LKKKKRNIAYSLLGGMNEVWTVLNVRMFFSGGSRVGECAHGVQVQSLGRFAVVIDAVLVCVCEV